MGTLSEWSGFPARRRELSCVAICGLCVEGESGKEGLTEETCSVYFQSGVGANEEESSQRDGCVGWEGQVDRVLSNSCSDSQ